MIVKPNALTAAVLAGLALAGTVAAQEPPPAAAAPTHAIDPAAMQALTRMGGYLRGLTSFSVEATDSTEDVLDSGQKIQLLKTVDLQVRKPDHLRADVVTDQKAREIFYDGKHFTLLTPGTGYYVTVAAPPTIGALLQEAEAKYGIEFPLVDLFLWGGEADATADVQEAMVVGTSKIGGQVADHYAFRQTDIDWEIWIAQGAAPLPLRYVITTKDEEGLPQYAANLSWDTQAKPADAVFTFTPGKDDHPIAIVDQAAAGDESQDAKTPDDAAATPSTTTPAATH
ncbi:DUF2092 domain-containing protein [uncultured Thiodictyon sp.]|uniref:DUF2092 domain-containing protein n=1 Tax=uncultured Thiodictyon sp. TaxID=1846217 RepID=UPI0025FBDAEF|nr:DUF2092 domain-containing protein [uncultured Thiodictyon sp.]